MKNCVRSLRCCLLAALLSAGLCLPAFAQGYTLAKTNPVPALDDKSILALTPQSDGGFAAAVFYLDYKNHGKAYYQQYTSPDGGKTWAEGSVAALDAAGEPVKPPFTAEDKDSNIVDAAHDENGNLIAVLITGDYLVETKRMTRAYNTYELAVQTKAGAVRKVPSFKMTGQDGSSFIVCPTAGGKEAAIIQGGEEGSSVYIVNLATGSARNVFKAAWDIFLYSSGRVWGFDHRNNTPMAVVADVETGKELYRQHWAFNDTHTDLYVMQRWAAGSDGSFYALDHSGIYRLRPGAAAYEKILDGKDCVVGQNGMICVNMTVGDDGSIYLVAGRFTPHEATTNTKLYRYVPTDTQKIEGGKRG